jgi:hypothetical protein
MAGPWEKYQNEQGAQSAGPWQKYGTTQRTASPPAVEQPRTLSGFASNIPGSFAGLFEPLLDLPGTAKGTALSIAGLIEKMSGTDLGQAKYADAVGQALMERYGSWDAIKKTAYEDPVGLVADAAGVITGLGGVVRGGAAAATRVGLKTGKLGQAGRVAEVVGRNIDPTFMPARAGLAVTEGIARTPYLGRAVTVPANVASEILGALTGGGGETIRTAWKTPSPDLKAAMRDQVSWVDIVNNANKAMKDLKEIRHAQYVSRMNEVFGTSKQLNINPVRKEISQILQDDFRGKVRIVRDKNGVYHPEFDLSQSRIKANAELVTDQLEEIANWTDYTPEGIDTLKKRISDTILTAPQGSQAETFLTKVVKRMDKHLEKELPGYSEMTAEYRRASEFIKMVEKEMSLSRGSNPGTTMRKLAKALNEKTGYRESLIDAIDQYTPDDIKLREHIAGITMSEVIPQSMIGRLAAGGLIGGSVSGKLPVSALTLTSFSSPRLVGETLVALSNMYKAAHGLEWRGGGRRLRTGYYGQQAYQSVNPVKVTLPGEEEPVSDPISVTVNR